jgi:F-type H+-transporting ATPase subunit delta
MTLVSRRLVTRSFADRLQHGESRAELLKQLAAYLITHKQLAQLELYVSDIETELAARGTIVADVTTAIALDEAGRTRVKEYVQKHTNSSAVTLREHVDTDLVGGVIVRMPGHELDASVASQLRQLKVA